MAETDVNNIIAIEQVPADSMFHITVVTKTELSWASLKVAKRADVQRQLRAGARPPQVLKEHAPLGQAPRIIPFSQLKAVEWYEDENELYVRYFDAKKKKERRTWITVQDRPAMLEAIRTAMSCEFRETDEPANIWHVGIPQFVYMGGAALFFGLPPLFGYLGGDTNTQIDTSNMRGRDQGLAELFNAVGPGGMLLIGAGIIAACLVWWAIRCRSAPAQNALTPIRNLPDKA